MELKQYSFGPSRNVQAICLLILSYNSINNVGVLGFRSFQRHGPIRQSKFDMRSYRAPGWISSAALQFDMRALTRLKASESNCKSDPTLHEDMMSRNELSHMMIKVSSVNETLQYYSGRGATVQAYRYNPKSGAESAFINFAPITGISPPQNRGFFSLEVVGSQHDKTGQESSENAIIQYIGLSMLQNFRDKSKLESVIRSSKPATSSMTFAEVDPSGIPIQSVASGPGDGLARVCLAARTGTTTLTQIEEFYVDVLGMQVVAQDSTCICLRYQSGSFKPGMHDPTDNQPAHRIGVPTTLVFEIPGNSMIKSSTQNCFDHLVIATDNMDQAMQHIQSYLGTSKEVIGEGYILMPPRSMFGTTLVGLKDPNGYDVYLMERKF